jgi:hypothetical protein
MSDSLFGPKKPRKKVGARKTLHFDGHTFDAGGGPTVIRREYIDTKRPGDYGADPMGDGTFRMVPSGDIVDYAERVRRLTKK